MTVKRDVFRRILSVVLCVLILLTVVPFALSAGASASAQTDTRVVDPSTMDDWKKIFLSENSNTENAGRIWTDKSVFTDASAFTDSVEMMNSDENFLVALSAIAANKSITGYSQVPTDTMFVLDISRSMGANTQPGDKNNNAVQELVDSTNLAIRKLLEANNNNRVGVVLYSGTYSSDKAADADSAMVILPMGRYEHVQGEYLIKDNHVFKVGEINFTAESVKVNSAVTCKGEAVQEAEREVFGGTFVQGGVYAAMKEFLNVEDTAIRNDAFQSGTKRLPVLVLMSDGVATSATTNYMGEGGSIGAADMGNGTTPEAELASAIPFATQLTCAYAKAKISEHYGRDGLFYTLGYNVKSTPVLDPESSSDTHTHWETYNITEAGGFMQLAVDSSYVSNGWWGEGHWDTQYKTVEKSRYELEEHYVDQYFSTGEDMRSAFVDITEKIIEKSLYYPTQVDSGNKDFDGYVEFIDDIGQFMEVKNVQGILLGDILFTGNNIASNFVGDGGKLGTIENPSNLGDEMIRAVKARLGIEKTADAQKLVDDAYKAGQLAYNAETGEYSNYIGWYADENGKYICHGTRDDKEYPRGAVFYNESYGYLGEVVDGHTDTDMMYISVQVHRRLATGTSAVIFRIPASLIPVINYNVTLSGNSVKNPGDVTLNVDNTMDIDTDNDGIYDATAPVTPIRLIFEVGLKDAINELNVSEIVPDSYKYLKNGEYTFYTNRWNQEDINHENPSVAENTVSFYEPSVENERYYYTENSTVYEKLGEEYVPYTGALTPAESAQELYREYSVFEVINDNEYANGRVHLHYEQMSAEALSAALPDTQKCAATDEKTTWYVPKGTVHRMYDIFHRGKGGFVDEAHTQSAENLTGSLLYSHYLKVEKTPQGDSYYADVILGNNGKLTLTQAQGIKITAVPDITMSSAGDVYEFDVETDVNLTGEYRLVRIDAKGNKTEKTVKFNGNLLQVETAAGETLYILDIPEGVQVTVRETSGENNYKVSFVNGEEKAELVAVVEANKMIKADFVNTLVPASGTATVVLWSKVSHPFGENYEIPENIEFTYDVEYVDAEGNLCSKEIKLPAQETAHISDVPLGAQVTIRETDVPTGFKNEEKEQCFVAEQEHCYVVETNNIYTPAQISPSVSLTGAVILAGRQNNKWIESDTFTVKLQKFAQGDWQEIAQTQVTKDSKTFDFSSVMSNEVYSEVGVYSYRVVEAFTENPYDGITYDKSVRWFDVYITDKDMDGLLEIDTIAPYGGTVANKQSGANSWVIKADFANEYSVAGSDAVSVTVRNEIVDNSQDTTVISAAGYEYGLYQGEKLVTVLPVTNKDGQTRVTLTYGVFDIGKHIHYVLRQMPAENPVEGMTYSTQEYNIAVEVEDNGKGGVDAYLTAAGNTEDAQVMAGDDVQVVFVNTYGEKAEPPVTEPESTEPGTVPPTEEEPTVPAPSEDATGTQDSQKEDSADAPQTGFITILDTCLWYLLLVIIVLGIAGAIFVGKKK